MTDHLTDDHALLKHEALDRTHVLMEALSLHVMDHAFAVQRPAITALANAALDQLGALYQAIGNAEAGDVELTHATFIPPPDLVADPKADPYDCGDRPHARPGDQWNCGNSHLHTQAALRLIKLNGITDVKAMDWLDTASYEAGPAFCSEMLEPAVPF